jgi:methylenetetrahydrofolate dehydrogenase (NADP+)/methenyltetrahydrofolate cyclohydrolase
MAATIIDGEVLAAQLRLQVQTEAEALAQAGRRPHLVAVQVGENPASRMYTNMQARSCQAVGIEYELMNLSESITQDNLLATLAELSCSAAVTGIILQMPLPPHINARAAQILIDPRKDVEGLHPVNLGRLFFGADDIAPCTAKAAVALLRQACPDLAGKQAVVVGHSEIVGKPAAMMLLSSPDKSPTVTVCHVATKDLAAHTRQAEVLIVAAGVSGAKWMGYQRRKQAGQNPPVPDLSPLVKADMLRPGAIVIDVAINRIPESLSADGTPAKDAAGKDKIVTVGDVDFAAAKEVAGAITPVPGGVGPVTVAILLSNTIAAAKAVG